MIVGIGVDIVSVERFTRHARQSPGLLARLFRESELVSERGSALGWPALAARFAAKEAAAKALGVPRAFDWHDFVVARDPSGTPSLELSGRGADEARRLGVGTWRLSLTENSGFAFATVIAET
ncbi:MAG TPA: holo-ACP synthase [Microbacteriaceae bacterium]|nr:holo-ACP synthase [Microbacteriaceae bacterium]